MLFTGNFNMPLRGFIFEEIDRIIYQQNISNWEELQVFLCNHALIAYEEKQNCAITHNQQIVFYMQQGEVVFDSNTNQNWPNLFKMMREG